jgi:hypothetical protein
MGRPLCAQRRSALDVGLSAVSFPDDSLKAFGPYVAWTISESTARWFASASASGVATRDGSSGSAELSLGSHRTLAGRWQGEATTRIGAVVGAQRSASSIELAARALHPIGDGGGWVRASGDMAARDVGLLGGFGADLGAWWQWWRAEVTASLARQWNTAQLFLGPGRGMVVGTTPVRYTEADITAHLDGDAASLSLSAAVRRDRGAPTLYSPAMSATAAFWLAENRALIVGVARQLPDFVHGADAVDYVSVGLRLNEPSPRVLREARIGPTVQVAGVDSARVVSVRAAGARTVEVMADFTGWEPIRLERRDDADFAATLTISPGSHHIMVRIDGGAWVPAANTPAVDDDFGGRVGLLLVP